MDSKKDRPYEIRFDYLPASPLMNGWVKPVEGDLNPLFHSAEKFPGGLFMQADGKVFAMDFQIPERARGEYRIQFDGEFRRDAVFYAEVEVVKTSGETENWWLAHIIGEKGRAPEK